MRLMLASQLASSPWMNPARWVNAAPTAVDPAASPGVWARDHYEAILASGPRRSAAVERVLAALMAYRIFPPGRLIAALPAEGVSPGATITQGIRLGPLGLIAAVRVVTVFDRQRDGLRRAGFSYVTLAGHPERGAMTFAVVDDEAAALARVEMDVISQPGHWLARLGTPLSRRLQRATTEAALAHLVALARTAG